MGPAGPSGTSGSSPVSAYERSSTTSSCFSVRNARMKDARAFTKRTSASTPGSSDQSNTGSKRTYEERYEIEFDQGYCRFTYEMQTKLVQRGPDKRDDARILLQPCQFE